MGKIGATMIKAILNESPIPNQMMKTGTRATAGIIRSSHPALFFALLNAALNQPPTFPTLLGRLAPEIDPETAWAQLLDTTIATLLHLPPSHDGEPAAGNGRKPQS